MPHSPAKLHEPRSRTRAVRPRRSPTERGYDSRWRRVADAFVIAYPYCVLCLCRGRVNSGAMRAPSRRGRSLQVDHIEPHRGDPARLFDQSNLQTLCAVPCHSVHKARIERRASSPGDAWFAFLRAEIAHAQSIEHLREHREGVPPSVLERLGRGGGVIF